MSHYSLAQEPLLMIPWAKKIAYKIDAKYRNSPILPVLIYRGMSGVAHATAVSLMYTLETGKTLGMIYVRKSNEKSHGSSIEYDSDFIYRENNPNKIDLIFIDDFISSGETFACCLEAFAREFKRMKIEKNEVFYTTKNHDDLRSLNPNSSFVWPSVRERMLSVLTTFNYN